MSIARPLVTELRRNVGRYIFPVAVCLHLLAALRWTPPDTDVWIDTSSAIPMGSALSGPFVACLATWAGTREMRSRAAVLRVTSPRPQWLGACVELLSLCLWVLAAYLLVAMVLVGRTSLGATWGQPDLLWLSAGALGLMLFVVAGYVAGRIVPRAFMAPLVGVICYLAVVLNAASFGTPWYFLNPAIMQRTTPFLAINHRLLALQIAWYTAIAASLFCAYAVALLGVRTRTVVTALAVSVAAAVAVAIPIANTRSLLQGVTAFDYVCHGGRVTICVHPAYSRGLGALQSEFDPLASRLTGTPFGATRLEQHRRGPRPAQGDTAWFAFDDLRPGFARLAVEEYVSSLAPVAACLHASSNEEQRNGAMRELAVQAWIADDDSILAGVPATARNAREQLATMSEAAGRAWLSGHAKNIVDCTLSWDDFR